MGQNVKIIMGVVLLILGIYLIVYNIGWGITGNVIFEKKADGFFDSLLDFFSPKQDTIKERPTPEESEDIPGLINPQLFQGSGWQGPTTVPAPIGNPSTPHWDANPIAHWSIPHFQDVHARKNLGILAYHINGIEKVSFSADNGPWVDVTQKSINPETGVEEYWVFFDPTILDQTEDRSQGPMEIRVIVYPTAGQVKVLQGTTLLNHDSSMIINVNPGAILPNQIRYVTTTGNDNNNCQSINTACATITSAIQKASISGNLDGAEILLGIGTWQIPELSGNYFTTNRWFTISSIPGVERENVIINGFATQTGSGLNLAHIKLSGISLTNPMRSNNGASFEDYFWLDNSKVYFLGNPVPSGACPPGVHILGGYGHAGIFSGAYFTDVHMTNTCTGPRALTLLRNVHAEYTGDGHATGTHTVINYSAKRTQQSNGIPNTPGEYHGDLYQFWDATENIILYNIQTVPGGNFIGRGIAQNAPIKDIVIDKSYVDPGFSGLNNDFAWAYSICNNVENFLTIDSTFIGPSDICGETGTPINQVSRKNILIENSLFEQNAWPHYLHYIPFPYPDPITLYVNAPITCTSEQTRPCSIQDGVCSGYQRTCLPSGLFTVCDYTTLQNYEHVEVTIDGLDNDCDGIVD
jgi:hypothetical protein